MSQCNPEMGVHVVVNASKRCVCGEMESVLTPHPTTPNLLVLKDPIGMIPISGSPRPEDLEVKC